jgi:chromate reductase, NAD(P)H dehydrogenase (quinone)
MHRDQPSSRFLILRITAFHFAYERTSQNKIMQASNKTLYILAISGSLRQQSSNTNLLRAAQKLAPKNVEIILYQDLATLPHFNPDLENPLPLTIAKLRTHIQKADGLLFSTPEYAHGVPGSLKNMLDWLVSGSEFMDKPVALLNASSRSTYAQASLTEIVKTMAGYFVEEATTTINLLGKHYDEASIIADPVMATSIEKALTTFAHAIGQHASRASSIESVS